MQELRISGKLTRTHCINCIFRLIKGQCYYSTIGDPLPNNNYENGLIVSGTMDRKQVQKVRQVAGPCISFSFEYSTRIVKAKLLTLIARSYASSFITVVNK